MPGNNIEEKLSFRYLPSFAVFLLQHVDDYTREIVRLAYEYELPLLTTLQHLSEEEKFQFAKSANAEFLTNLADNTAAKHLEAVINRWLTNQFENIKRLDVDARDITLLYLIRGKAQKKFINQYTHNTETVYQLHNEIDDLNFIYSSSFSNEYLKVLREKIEAESHFSRNIIEVSPGIIFIYDLDEKREVYINGRVEEVTGYTPDEVKSIKDLIPNLTHPDDLPVVAQFIQGIIEDKKERIHQADYRFKNKAGEYHWIRCYAVAYQRDNNGKVRQILGNSFDVTNEKEIGDELLKRERQLLEAQAIGEIGSYELDLLTDTSVNTPQLRKIFEVVGRGTDKWMEKVHPDDVQKVKSAMAESFKTGRYECEFRFLAATGEKVVHSKGEVSFDENQKPLKLTGTVQDITERKRIEQNLLKSKLELEHSNKQLEEFAFVASHDLKEPLRKVGLYSSIIMSSDWDALSEKTKAGVEKIADAAKRMQKLIEGILAYSTITAPGAGESYSLQKLYEEALDNLEYKIHETGAIVTSDNLPEATVVPFQIQQLFQNLVGNALKFSKEGVTPHISVTHKVLSANEVASKDLKPSSKYLQIAVTDNGIGFNTVATEKIFGLFQRLHTRSDYEGSGLGLAICKRIVENHGGTISASSDIGKGSTFTVILPL